MAGSSDSAQRLFVQAASTSGGPSDAAAASGCPVSSEDRAKWLAQQKQTQTQQQHPAAPASAEDARQSARINMPAVPNAPLDAAQLSTARRASTIPIADPSAVPAHQQGAPAAGGGGGGAAAGDPVWMYPSEQQFYNAMARKGWQPQQADMPAVVAIHNAVNERSWEHVLAWEALHACDCPNPKLLRFRGRPNEYSPKAQLLNFLGYKLPFDRHDWIVDRCGAEVRYVIDFYAGAPQPGATASMHLDVRPALDSFGAALDRVRMQWRWVASGRWRDPQP